MRPTSISLSSQTYSSPIPVDHSNAINQISLGCDIIVAGTLTYQVQYTFDDIGVAGYNPNTGNWQDHPTLTAKTVSDAAILPVSVRAVRLNVTAYTSGTVRLTVITNDSSVTGSASTAAIGAGTSSSGFIAPANLLAATIENDGTPSVWQSGLARASLLEGTVYDIRQNLTGPLVTGTDYRALIQYALDNAPFGSTVYIPPTSFGTLVVNKNGANPWCLKLTRFVHIYFDSFLYPNLTGGDTTTDLLRVAINDVGAGPGVGDIRFHKMRLKSSMVDGRSAVRIEQTLPALRMTLYDSLIQGIAGPAAFFGGDLQGTIVKDCTIQGGIEFGAFGGVYHADNVLVKDNTIFGAHAGVKMDMIYGAYSHAIINNTIVSDGSAIDIINGSQIKIRDNQFEQPNPNTHPFYSGMVVIRGDTYAAESIDISGNNFGGGSYVLYNIFTVVTNKLHIEDNDFYTPFSGADYVIGASTSKNTRIGRGNRYRGPARGTGGYSDIGISDAGVGTTGYRKFLSTLTLSNGWTAGGDAFIIVNDGVAQCAGVITGGTLTGGTAILTLPLGYRPYVPCKVPVVTSSGVGSLDIAVTGVVSVGVIPGATVNLDNLHFDTVGDI